MANPSVHRKQLTAGVSNGIALSQTPGAAGPLTLNGSLATAGVASLGTAARRVLISSAGADSAIVFTVTGTDRNGNTQSETITGVASGTPQYSMLDYLTVTRIATSAATAGAITAGTNSVGSTAWQVDDFLAKFWALAGGISGPAGTTYTLEFTYDDPNAQVGGGQIGAEQFSMEANSFVPPLVWAYTGIVAATGNNSFSFPNQPIFAHRITILSGTGMVTMQSIQAGPYG